MNHDQHRNPPPRRHFLTTSAALLIALTLPSWAEDYPTSKVDTTGLAVTDTTVTVGQLHSATGTMAISETGSIEAEQLAIDQINAAGGGARPADQSDQGGTARVIGRPSRKKPKKLLINDKVAAVFGCWTSASRKAVLPVFEKENGIALLSHLLRRSGAIEERDLHGPGRATQQILAGLAWIAKEKHAKTFYLIGSDYIWPRTSNKIARKYIENVLKGKPWSGEEYYALGQTQFVVANQQDQNSRNPTWSMPLSSAEVMWHSTSSSKPPELLRISRHCSPFP